MIIKLSMWTLEEGLAVIRTIQPYIHTLGYHVALAGGVLNIGHSLKDLDLVFLPLTNEKKPELAELVTTMVSMWGTPHDNITDPEPCVSLRYQASHVREEDGKRIDVFVV